ncbi:MAG: phosphoribosylformylglycinamidine cyclo-ligase [Myxococcales bacterium]|nr:phosphoribosylformylglycinamidine cyclo-ligase [Myxococcales bacterium]|tara:strand:- start:518 stop:1567 length:1050 start_codon:yes stop_codon:yes gene_type:complete
MTKEISYSSAGVDIEAADAAIEGFKGDAQATYQNGVLSGIGGFAGLFHLGEATPDMTDPVLVSGTDGVGTKLLVAQKTHNHRGIGQDLVAMCVNDILCVGARPLFFLDYFAAGGLAGVPLKEVVQSIAKACADVSCALLGGETAEMPGLYAKGDYDLAGFCVGAVDRKKIIDGQKVQAGDVVIGLASSGLHSNGFSLARKVLLEHAAMDLQAPYHPSDDQNLGEALLRPTHLYVQNILDLFANDVDLHSLAHITGGGLPGNIARNVPDTFDIHIDPTSWSEPAIFGVIREKGPVNEEEMRKTFNLGIGFTVIVPRQEADKCHAILSKQNIQAWTIGEVTNGSGQVIFGD